MKAKVRRVRHGKRLLEIMHRYNTVVDKIAKLTDDMDGMSERMLDWNELRGGKQHHDAAGNQQHCGSSTGKDEP